MKFGNLGEFSFRARTIESGHRFRGAYRIERARADYARALPFRGERFTDDSFEERWQAEEAAFQAAIEAIKMLRTTPA